MSGLKTKELVDIEPIFWKDFILGLQEKLGLRQFELLEAAKIKKDYHVSEWISGQRIPTLEKRKSFFDLAIRHNFEFNELIEFGRVIRKSVLVDGQWFSTENSFYREASDSLFIFRKNRLI